MKLADCLAQVDELKPNTYDDAMKIRWISELDGRIFNELVLTHVRDKVKPEIIEPIVTPGDIIDEENDNEPSEAAESEGEDNNVFNEEELVDPPTEFFGYTDDDLDKELIAPFPYDNIYRNYIFALIDYSNGEVDRYQASMTMFNSSYADFCNFYNRTHLPLKTPLKVF